MKSTREEVRALDQLVRGTKDDILGLQEAGKRVHIIWDFDFVLSTGLSDDVAALTGRDLKKYFDYEERLCFNPPLANAWFRIAREVGHLHASQDIVTARSSYLAFRVMLFCLWRSRDPGFMRWILPIGHQPKGESFKIILNNLKDDPHMHVFFVDDAKKHVDLFAEVANGIGMGNRTRSILAPRVRDYTDEELKEHYDAVIGAKGDGFVAVPHWKRGEPDFIVAPQGVKQFREAVTKLPFMAYDAAMAQRRRNDIERMRMEVEA